MLNKLKPMAARLLSLLVSLCFILATPTLGAEPKRAVLLVWDSGDPAVTQKFTDTATQLKSLRAAGQFAKVKNLSYAIKVYDFGKKPHADALKTLKVSRDSCPYVSVVNLDSEQLPTRVIWGKRYDEPTEGVDAVKEYLGMDTHGVAVAIPSNPTIDEGRLPASGGSTRMVWEKKSLSEAPAWLSTRKQTVNYGSHNFKFVYSVEPAAKYEDLSDWADPYTDQLNNDSLISHATGRHWNLFRESDQKRMLLGWTDKEGRRAWVALWRVKGGWSYETISGKKGGFKDGNDYYLYWDVEDARIKLNMVSPTYHDGVVAGGWTRNHLIWEFIVTHS